MLHELRSIALGLDWCRARGIDIEQRLGTVDMLSRGEVVGLHDALRLNTQPRRPEQQFVQPLVHHNRCVYLRDYLVWRAESVVSRARPERQVEVRNRLDDYRKRVNSLLTKPKVNGREGLAPEDEALLRTVITPGHHDNPFRAKHQHRNYALILLYLDLPVRLSEALVLKGNDLALGGPSPLVTISRRADDPADTRRRQPLVKTAARVLPLGFALASALTEWVLVHRRDASRYPGAKRTPFLFVSERGEPLAIDSVGDMFTLLRRRVPRLPDDLTAHVLRHTWNDRFSETADKVGLPEAEEQTQRSNLNGWRHGSKTAEVYTRRHTRVAAQKAALMMQRRDGVGGKNGE